VSLVHAAPVALVAASFNAGLTILLIVAGVCGVAVGHYARLWRTKSKQKKQAEAAAARKKAAARPAARKSGASKTSTARTASGKSRPRTPPPGKAKKS
jgi:hypothetical protein